MGRGGQGQGGGGAAVGSRARRGSCGASVMVAGMRLWWREERQDHTGSTCRLGHVRPNPKPPRPPTKPSSKPSWMRAIRSSALGTTWRARRHWWVRGQGWSAGSGDGELGTALAWCRCTGMRRPRWRIDSSVWPSRAHCRASAQASAMAKFNELEDEIAAMKAQLQVRLGGRRLDARTAACVQGVTLEAAVVHSPEREAARLLAHPPALTPAAPRRPGPRARPSPPLPLRRPTARTSRPGRKPQLRPAARGCSSKASTRPTSTRPPGRGSSSRRTGEAAASAASCEARSTPRPRRRRAASQPRSRPPQQRRLAARCGCGCLPTWPASWRSWLRRVGRAPGGLTPAVPLGLGQGGEAPAGQRWHPNCCCRRHAWLGRITRDRSGAADLCHKTHRLDDCSALCGAGCAVRSAWSDSWLQRMERTEGFGWCAGGAQQGPAAGAAAGAAGATAAAAARWEPIRPTQSIKALITHVCRRV